LIREKEKTLYKEEAKKQQANKRLFLVDLWNGRFDNNHAGRWINTGEANW